MGRKRSRGKARAIRDDSYSPTTELPIHRWSVDCILCKDVIYYVNTITKNSHISNGYIKAFNYSSTEIGIIPVHYNTLGTFNDTTIEWTCKICNYTLEYPKMI